MEKRNIAGLVVGVGTLLIAVPFALGYLGIDFPNPFQPIATVTVTTTPYCIPLTPICAIGAGTTVIDVITTPQISILGTYTYVCLPELGWSGKIRLKLVIRDAIGEIVYDTPMKPATAVCNTPVQFTFRFNYEKGQHYMIYLDVYEETGQILQYSMIQGVDL